MKKNLLYCLSSLCSLLAIHCTAQVWVYEGNPGCSAGAAANTALAIDNAGTPYVVYSDEGLGVRISVNKLVGTTWTAVGSPAFSASYANYTSIAINRSGVPYVAFQDGLYTSDTAGATVMKFDGSSWVNVGNPGFSSGQAQGTAIAIDSAGTPYVVFQDGNWGKASVMKFNGTSWVYVGSRRFTDSTATFTTIAIDAAGTPYIAFQDAAAGYKATVMKFDGSAWVPVGSTGISAGMVNYPAITIDRSGAPYIVFADYANDQHCTVLKFNGTSWVNVGTPGFSIGPAACTTIAIDTAGTPYVAFADINVDAATAMKFDGSTWVNVANRGFSGNFAQWTSIAIQSDGTPLVAFQDLNHSNRASVMKLDTALSPITGTAILCTGETTTLTDAKPGGTWSIDNPAVASINSSGIVTGITAGTAAVSYSRGSYFTSFSVVIDTIPPAGALIASVDSICPGDSIIIHNAVPGGYWYSMDTTVAQIRPDMYITDHSYGLLVGIAGGTAGLKYINTNHCGADTTYYVFRVGGCDTRVNELSQPLAAGSSIAPNPATTAIALSAPYPIEQITITDLLGHAVCIKGNNLLTETIDISTLIPGMYFIKINGKDVRKLMKL